MSVSAAKVAVMALVLVAAACAPASAPTREQPPAPAAAAPSSARTSPALATSPAARAPTAQPSPTPDLSRARFSTSGWKTDFTKASVPFEEISSGGPPRDGIPPIDKPTFETVPQADAWLKPLEPVVRLQLAGEARGYPLQILTWHEIVNDEVGGTPVSVTFCPLCNTAIAFDRRLGGRVLDFGTTGNLRYSDLVMWDRQTESWWQQVSGEAIVGELTGQRLTILPAEIVSWEEFRAGHPRGSVLSRNTGFSRSYGTNPYVGYDRVDQPPFLFKGPTDGRLPPMERVVAVEIGGEAAAYPFALLRRRPVVHDEVGGQPVVVFYRLGTASALDQSQIATSKDVGATGVYRPAVDGRPLTFVWRDDAFVDLDTGSRWTLLGQAASGSLAGKQLEAVTHANPFWFAWAAFRPATRVYQ